MRILSFLIVSLLLAGTAMAQSSFDGFYIGVQAAYSDHSIQSDQDLALAASLDESVGLPLLVDLEKGVDVRGFGGNGVIGWGASAWNGVLYGSVEFEGGYDGARSLQESLEVEGELKVLKGLESFGLGYRLGAICAEKFLFYGRMGWQRTTLEYDEYKEHFHGFRVGGGVEAMLVNHVGIRLEYAFTTYSDGISGVEIDMDQHLSRIGVAYYF
jgi:opacity protein-like surface antigen